MIYLLALIIAIAQAVDPNITIKECGWSSTQYYLGHQNEATQSVIEFTIFTICKSSNNKIIVDFFNEDHYITAPQPNCNDPLSSYDIDVIFIGTKTEYIEFQISPNGGFVYALHSNPTGDCKNVSKVYKQCNEIQYFADYVTPTSWKTHIEMPISMFSQPIYANFYRNNIMNDGSKHYMSYNPINSSPACYHRPDKFVQLIV